MHPVGGHHDPKKRKTKVNKKNSKLINKTFFFILFQSDVVACISSYVMNHLENENLQEETWTLNHSIFNHLGIELKEKFKIFVCLQHIYLYLLLHLKNVRCATGSSFLAKFYFHK